MLSPERASRPGPRPIRERRYRDDPDEDTEDDDEFDNQNLVERTISYSSHLGIEPESLEQAMFRTNSRERYSGSQRASRGNSRRPSTAAYQSVPDLDLNGRISEEEDEIEGKPKSPYMNGISRRLFWLIYSGVMTNVFIATFDSTIMASSHPVITSYFHSSNSASWLSTAFLLTSTAFQPLFGRLSDTMGRKKPYMFGMFLFLAGTIWCALAQSMLSFIFARALTGLGAGGMLTMGSIITSDLVPIEIRGNYQSYINIVFGSGSALGAATGGFLADNLGWRWEFGIQGELALS